MTFYISLSLRNTERALFKFDVDSLHFTMLVMFTFISYQPSVTSPLFYVEQNYNFIFSKYDSYYVFAYR
jgi:hypothetical protein